MKYIITESQYRLLTESINFDDVYKQTYRNMFRGVCMKYANGDYDLASDYCQLGYLRVNDKLDTFKGEGSLEGWVRRVISTTILNELRGKKKAVVTTKDFDFERNDVSDEPEEKYEDMLMVIGDVKAISAHFAAKKLGLLQRKDCLDFV
jgi:RNA polymerase sigma factor (sigma-70 family)